MKHWYVIHSQPNKETLAASQLMHQGFDVYLPRYKKERRHARKRVCVMAPLFPRYLFVSFDPETDRWRSVNGTKGVAYLLSQNERPSRVPNEIIENLQQKEDEAGCVSIDSLVMFMKGDKLRVLEGAFEGCTAIFEKFDDNARVQLLLNFLNRETKLILPLKAVEAA